MLGSHQEALRRGYATVRVMLQIILDHMGQRRAELLGHTADRLCWVPEPRC